MVKLVTVEQMRAIEKATDEAGVSYSDMMQHAGRAVADVVLSLIGEPSPDTRIAILVGPGNNGGDGLVAARILKEEAGLEVGCYLSKAREDSDAEFATARDAGVFMAVAGDDQRWRILKTLIGNADVVVDAVLGTGTQLPLRDEIRKLLHNVTGVIEQDRGLSRRLIYPALPSSATRHRWIVAVDCPTGLDCDTGALESSALKADVTVTFAAAKIGQLMFPGAEVVGELVIADIGTPANLAELEGVTTELASGEAIAKMLPRRPSDAHKGTFGRVAVVAGSVNYTGAARLAGEAVYRAGAGLVTMAVPQVIYPILAAQIPEATWLLLPHEMGVLNAAAVDVLKDELGEIDALLIGPGLARDENSSAFMRGLLRGTKQAKRGSIGFVAPQPATSDDASITLLPTTRVVIDADGLNLLAEIDGWWTLLPPDAVLTPHPGEMARLTGLEREAIQQDRLGIAARHAAEWSCVVVLKGAYTVIAAPDGRVTILPFALDALATGGTGDVLAGVIAGLLAQGTSPFEAAVAGGYIHGLAGRIAAEELGSRSVMASDVLDSVSEALYSLSPD